MDKPSNEPNKSTNLKI